MAISTLPSADTKDFDLIVKELSEQGSVILLRGNDSKVGAVSGIAKDGRCFIACIDCGKLEFSFMSEQFLNVSKVAKLIPKEVEICDVPYEALTMTCMGDGTQEWQKGKCYELYQKLVTAPREETRRDVMCYDALHIGLAMLNGDEHIIICADSTSKEHPHYGVALEFLGKTVKLHRLRVDIDGSVHQEKIDLTAKSEEERATILQNMCGIDSQGKLIESGRWPTLFCEGLYDSLLCIFQLNYAKAHMTEQVVANVLAFCSEN